MSQQTTTETDRTVEPINTGNGGVPPAPGGAGTPAGNGDKNTTVRSGGGAKDGASPGAGNPVNGATFVQTALRSSIAPVEKQLADQQQQLTKATEMLTSMAKHIAEGQQPAGTILPPAPVALAPTAPAKLKKKKDKKKKRDDISSASSDSSEDDTPDRHRRALDLCDLRTPTDPAGFRAQVFLGFEASGKLALSLLQQEISTLEDAEENRKAVIKALKPLIRRAEVGLAVTHSLASEARVGLTAADICFSAIANENRFHKKDKPRALVAEFREAALQRARRSGGGGNGNGAGPSNGDGDGGARGGAPGRPWDRDGRKRDNENHHRYARDEKRRY